MPGRKAIQIDHGFVERAARLGLTVEEIAELLGVSKRTLQYRAAEALRRGRAQMVLRLRRMQWRAAKRGSVPMLIWLGKQYLGQSDRVVAVKGEKVTVVEEVVYPEDPGGNGQDVALSDGRVVFPEGMLD